MKEAQVKNKNKVGGAAQFAPVTVQVCFSTKLLTTDKTSMLIRWEKYLYFIHISDSQFWQFYSCQKIKKNIY